MKLIANAMYKAYPERSQALSMSPSSSSEDARGLSESIQAFLPSSASSMNFPSNSSPASKQIVPRTSFNSMAMDKMQFPQGGPLDKKYFHCVDAKSVYSFLKAIESDCSIRNRNPSLHASSEVFDKGGNSFHSSSSQEFLNSPSRQAASGCNTTGPGGSIPYFQCNKCGKVFTKEAALGHHMTIHGGKERNCKVCGRLFKQKSTLDTHMRIHTGEKPFKCQVCDYSSAFLSGLRQHKMSHNHF
ncbi:B-cell CLL/lymphoma 6 member B protein-like [Uloborus diversus]|uniref:B-cell CLL/lymphoma 6 member B protein-like n=1 Tax=Uloborus diversus TaxID=327109 RepID=UPI00240A251A|nr:B-cell CLL/lymphoma 6 member B protein-like [Uloborus diversus]